MLQASRPPVSVRPLIPDNYDAYLTLLQQVRPEARTTKDRLAELLGGPSTRGVPGVSLLIQEKKLVGAFVLDRAHSTSTVSVDVLLHPGARTAEYQSILFSELLTAARWARARELRARAPVGSWEESFFHQHGFQSNVSTYEAVRAVKAPEPERLVAIARRGDAQGYRCYVTRTLPEKYRAEFNRLVIATMRDATRDPDDRRARALLDAWYTLRPKERLYLFVGKESEMVAASIMRILTRENHLRFEGQGVLSSSRGTGALSVMALGIYRWAAFQGYESLHGAVDANNLPMLNIIETLGFNLQPSTLTFALQVPPLSPQG
ncbi:hypothetical protein [Deinococcus yavapaiensis]|uniref:GNAT family N-acetyltransferase n=1 Tax=Deinococcus yavapaiensis KR-236 TaxID=694435 RepID=A0A318S1K2_9DEIO|nr:hypothetical protein [Deinococcus yavapaiensis]PYE51106.1 hypothetical protein DES52_11538 [Deinococcus yavapaiensis KR-236]